MTEVVETFATVDSTRIRVLDAPILAPGTCCICGSSRGDDRKYIDLGIDLDHIGVMYFCTFCIHELVNVLGCLMPDQFQALQDELDSARQTIIDFQQEKAAIDNVVDTLRSTGLFSGTDLVTFKTPVEPEQQQSGTVQDIVPDERETTRNSKNSKQSDPKQGSDDLPKFGSNDLESFL